MASPTNFSYRRCSILISIILTPVLPMTSKAVEGQSFGMKNLETQIERNPEFRASEVN